MAYPRLLLLCIVTAWLVLFPGCLPSKMVINWQYRPETYPTPILPPGEILTLCIEAVGGVDGFEWIKTDKYSWRLDRRPAHIVREVLERDLPLMAIEVKGTCEDVRGRLRVSVRWFGPYGNSPVSAAVILAMTLFEANGDIPVWHGKIEGGVLPAPMPFGKRNIERAISKAINQALSKVMSRLRWNGEFCQAVRLLAGR
ncbi:MAG: hypothetical protein JRJ29_09160 [Deltaproteobacteria bacterium]|nr:hypothetical protein [Deltaproteobacteria bacterium]